MNTQARQLLTAVRDGEISVDDALLRLKTEPFEDIGFAKVDTHRGLRRGAHEVIYGEGKTVAQIIGIMDTMREKGLKHILVTRLDSDKAKDVADKHDISYDPVSRIGILGEDPPADGLGKVLVATAGTSDMPVAEEAALTAGFYGNEVLRLYDVGVSGIHRLLSYKDEIMSASVIVVCAGMEGALAGVIGGLADCPVIAVPTSVGYGASFGGLAALLSMLNSCAGGISVVNIDNGFGAGYLASMINHMA